MLNDILEFAIPVVSILFAIIFVAMYEVELKNCILRVGGSLYTPFNATAQHCGIWQGKVLAWLRSQAVSLSYDSTQVVPAIIGAYLYLILAATLITSDVPLASMTLEAWGFASLNKSMKGLHIIDSGVCMAISLILAPVLWGLLFFDAIGSTHFTGSLTNRLGKNGRRILTIITVVGFLCSASGLVLMALDRGGIISVGLTFMVAKQENISDQSIIPTSVNGSEDPLAALQQENIADEVVVSGFTAKIPIAVMTLTTANIILLTAICMAPGLFSLLWTVIGCCYVFLLPIALFKMATTAISFLISHLTEVIMAIFLLIVAFGKDLASIFVGSGKKQATSHSSGDTPTNLTAAGGSTSEDRGSSAGFDPFS